MRAKTWVVAMHGFMLIAALLHFPANVIGQVRPSRLAVWDTQAIANNQLLPEEVSMKTAGKRLTRGQKVDSFQGDVVMTNGRIAAVVRKSGTFVEIYSTAGQSRAVRGVASAAQSGGTTESPVWCARLRLQTLAGEPAARLERMALIEHSRSAVRLQAVYQTAAGESITASFRLKRGEIALEAVPGPGAGRLNVECPGRYVVLPDFFADDILIDAATIPVPVTDIPSENFLLHMTDEGNAIAMCVFENNDQDVKVRFSGKGADRIVTGSEIRFGKEGKIWVALMAGPGIWHAFNVNDQDAGRIIPLDWKTPFVAQWRVDFTRRNELMDSWEMLYAAQDGSGYVKPSWLPGGSQGGKPSRTTTGEIDVDAYKVGGPASNRLGPDRKRWITVLGRFQYPCWTDSDQRGYIQPLKHNKIAFRGPAVIYPINRLPETPVERFTTVDVVRGTLGVEPCQYLLNVEGQRQDHVGRATCHVRRLLNEIYEGKQQKARREDIENYLDDGLDFVKHIRSRITLYIEFGQAMRTYLAQQKKSRPDIEEALTEMEQIVVQLDECMEAHREKIKSPNYVASLNEDFRKTLLDYQAPDSLARLKTFTDALTRVGGSQDSLVGECRWIVRRLRQRAALTMAVDPRFADVGKEIRARTQKVLLKPSAYEGARH